MVREVATLAFDNGTGGEVRPLTQRPGDELLTARIQVQRGCIDQPDAGLERRVQRTHRQILVQVAVGGAVDQRREADPGRANAYGCHLDTRLAEPLARQSWSLRNGYHPFRT